MIDSSNDLADGFIEVLFCKIFLSKHLSSQLVQRPLGYGLGAAPTFVTLVYPLATSPVVVDPTVTLARVLSAESSTTVAA